MPAPLAHDGTADPAARPVRILTVCTGNLCRSPYAEALLRARLDEVRPGAFVVSSAGTDAPRGAPVDPGSAALLADRGVSSAGLVSRRLTAGLAGEADIVLVMAAQHAHVVVDELPAAHRRTFLITAFAHQLEAIGRDRDWSRLFAAAGVGDDVVSRWAALPDILAVEGPRVRRRRQPPDVHDPVGGPPRAFARMAAEIDPAVERIAAWEAGFPR